MNFSWDNKLPVLFYIDLVIVLNFKPYSVGSTVLKENAAKTIKSTTEIALHIKHPLTFVSLSIVNSNLFYKLIEYNNKLTHS